METKLSDTLMVHLRYITAFITLQYEMLVEETGLTVPQAEILMYLSDIGVCSVSDVAEFFLLDKSTASRMISRLEELGIIQTFPGTEDRRTKMIKIVAPERFATLVDQWKKVNVTLNDAYAPIIRQLEEKMSR